MAWNSQHPQKDTVLIFEIREKLGENANYLKEKHVGEPSSIPKWFKNKANLWMGWEIKDQEFLKAAEKYADLNLIDKSGQKSIPDWFKQTTKWYLDETISEKEFMSSIKYMAKSH